MLCPVPRGETQGNCVQVPVIEHADPGSTYVTLHERTPPLPLTLSQGFLSSFEETINSYRKMLDELDLAVARKNRARRKLVRTRGKIERGIEEIDEVLERVSSEHHGAEEFLNERSVLQMSLDETDLTIAHLDRERKALKRKQKKVERWVDYEG